MRYNLVISFTGVRMRSSVLSVSYKSPEHCDAVQEMQNLATVLGVSTSSLVCIAITEYMTRHRKRVADKRQELRESLND
ncbi:transcriptional repressoR [Caudoviricetes sp.]|nr:transcriptional repressoR [Caudoviricetes sp.]